MIDVPKIWTGFSQILLNFIRQYVTKMFMVSYQDFTRNSSHKTSFVAGKSSLVLFKLVQKIQNIVILLHMKNVKHLKWSFCYWRLNHWVGVLSLIFVIFICRFQIIELKSVIKNNKISIFYMRVSIWNSAPQNVEVLAVLDLWSPRSRSSKLEAEVLVDVLVCAHRPLDWWANFWDTKTGILGRK